MKSCSSQRACTRLCKSVLCQHCRQQQDEEWRERVKRIGQGAAGKRPWPGCTALAVLLYQNTMLVANAGGALVSGSLYHLICWTCRPKAILTVNLTLHGSGCMLIHCLLTDTVLKIQDIVLCFETLIVVSGSVQVTAVLCYAEVARLSLCLMTTQLR